VGESGSGKSVGAMSILRLIPDPPGRITGGEVLFAGRDLFEAVDDAMREIRGGEIGMVFQEPMTSLNPVLTIGRQITEVLEQHRGATPAAARQRAEQCLVSWVSPTRRARLKQYPHQLSGGMRQRIMIAIALACDPKLIIADEPTTALDVTIQAQILELMKELDARLNIALIINHHNLGVVARYANRGERHVCRTHRRVRSRRGDLSRPAAPLHYRTAAFGAPLDRPRQIRLDPVEGQPPDLARLDGGCAFRPRCRFAVAACAEARPALTSIEGIAAGDTAIPPPCFRTNDIATETGRAA